MPDYGDDRGFRSRGVPADIGFDRAGPGIGVGPRDMPYSAPRGPHARVGPPENIGRDRAGGFGFNDFRQIMDERMPAVNRLGNLPGARWRDYMAGDLGGGLGNQFARNAGANGMLMASGPGMDDDDYGPFISPSVLEMDIEDIIYGPSDEYDFDRKRGYPGYKWGSPPVYSARGGLI